MKSLFKALLIIGILGSIAWLTTGEYMKKLVGIGIYGSREPEGISPATAQCSDGHCSKNGGFQCE